MLLRLLKLNRIIMLGLVVLLLSRVVIVLLCRIVVLLLSHNFYKEKSYTERETTEK
jgi:hypothetical protein